MLQYTGNSTSTNHLYSEGQHVEYRSLLLARRIERYADAMVPSPWNDSGHEQLAEGQD